MALTPSYAADTVREEERVVSGIPLADILRSNETLRGRQGKNLELKG